MSTRSTLTKSLLALGLLISVATLTACGQKQTTTSTSSSSAKVSKTSSSSSLAKAKTSQKSSTQAENNETTTESSTASETAATTTNQATTTATSSFDVQAIANGDFSTLVGTWKNGKGLTIVIDGDKVTFVDTEDSDPNQYHLIESHTLTNGRVGASLGFYNNGERQGGANLSIVPAGVENILGETSDIDHLEIGHGVNAANPDELFFRQ